MSVMPKLEEEQENINSYSRRDCLEFHGIPQNSTKNTDELVKRVANLVGVEINPYDISPIVCHLEEDQLHPLLQNLPSDVLKKLFIKARES